MNPDKDAGSTGATRPPLTEMAAPAAAPVTLPAREQAQPDAEWLGAVLADAADRVPAHGRWWRDARRRRLLALADGCAAALAICVAVPPERAIWLLAFLPVWILVAKLAGLYDRDHRALRHLTVDEAPVIAAWGVIGAAVGGLLGGITPAGEMDLSELLVMAGVAILAGLVFRVVA